MYYLSAFSLINPYKNNYYKYSSIYLTIMYSIYTLIKGKLRLQG